jgi:hypothetical protein
VHASKVARFRRKIVVGPSDADCSIWIGSIVADGYGPYFITRAGMGFCRRTNRCVLELIRLRVIERYRREPQAGARALFLEAVARRLNERQTLVAGSSAADLVAQADLVEVQARFEAMVDECEHAIYDVRRLTRGMSARLCRCGITVRSMRAAAYGSHLQMNDELHLMPAIARYVPTASRSSSPMLPAVS